jgi:hypothetical protein
MIKLSTLINKLNMILQVLSIFLSAILGAANIDCKIYMTGTPFKDYTPSECGNDSPEFSSLEV